MRQNAPRLLPADRGGACLFLVSADHRKALPGQTRTYDERASGRSYVHSDPIGLHGGVNTYVYVLANPLNHRDPKGRIPGWTDPSGPPDMDPLSTPPCQCPPVPEAPTECTNVNVNANMDQAQNSYNPFWFYNQVTNHGPRDYKQQGPQFDDFGNFNYGATGNAFGFPDQVLLRMAGYAQMKAGTWDPSFGYPWGGAPYGDDPAGQVQIQRGIDYSRCHCDW